MDKIFSFYQQKTTDEFLPPMVKEGYDGVSEDDSIIFLNFRKDRATQISQNISEKGFDNFYTMTNYSQEINSKVIFEDFVIENTLGDILEKNNKTQLRISETEKYAHITFFFDGGSSKEHVGKKEILVDSPNVATYDLKPEMSIDQLTEKVLESIKKQDFDFIVVNLPNADMVAHTGSLGATISAVEFVDKAVEKIVSVGLSKNYSMILTADHGNAEEVSETNRTHTKNKVPFTLISKDFEDERDIFKKGEFGLASVLPTVLDLMGIEKVDGKEESLLKK
jgi:2,3-bisphosphoglycerate-independent phosphoglycerate mutase